MNLLVNLRRHTFWFIDKIRGSFIKKYLKELQEIEEYNIIYDYQFDDYYHTKIHSLLQHCVNTVPAYANFKDILQKNNCLCAFPVINKLSFKLREKDFLSSAFDKQKLIPMSTSGSTGTPFTCWQNVDKKRHVNAEVLFYGGKLGYEIGKRMIYLRSVVGEVKKSPIKQFLQNIFLINCKDLSDEGIKKLLSRIKKLSQRQDTFILSYASTLDAFRKYFDKYGTAEVKSCRIKGIISGSEMLCDITRETIGKAFSCEVVSRYSNEENGFIGQDWKENNIFIHNRANYYIEILKFDSDEPTTYGEIGRIVITDLYNYAMPMVRYDTGDVGAWQEITINGVKRKAIGQFGGRKVDMIYDCQGRVISPHTITNNMWEYPNIKQFQFIQTNKCSYKLRINTDVKIDELKLINLYKNIVGSEASITIEYCDEIPVLASGKRRYIVNEMLTNKNK